MAARSESFAARARAVMVHLNKGIAGSTLDIPVSLLAEYLDLVSDADKRPLYNTLRDFMKSGEVARVRPGVYRYIGKKKATDEKRHRMWRLIRARRQVNVNDLVELCGVSAGYAQEYLRMLVRQELVKPSGSGRSRRWRLVKDVVEMPVNGDKAAALRQYRRKVRDALGAVVAADNAIKKVRMMLEECDAAEDAQGA